MGCFLYVDNFIDKCVTIWYHILYMKKERENKTEFLQVRVTKKEKLLLEKLAKNQRDSLSRYIRGLLNLNG